MDKSYDSNKNQDEERNDEMQSPTAVRGRGLYEKIDKKRNTMQVMQKVNKVSLKNIINKNRDTFRAKSFIDILNSGQTIDYKMLKKQMTQDLENQSQEVDSHRQYIEKADIVKKISGTSTVAFSIKPVKFKPTKEADEANQNVKNSQDELKASSNLQSKIDPSDKKHASRPIQIKNHK